MAKNGKVGDGHRIGAVKNRTQIFNPVTGHYIKRDSSTGQFIDVKLDGKPFKGVTREKSITRPEMLSISKSVANKAEQSVIMVMNKRAK